MSAKVIKPALLISTSTRPLVQRPLTTPVVGRNVAGNGGDLTADGLDLAGANLQVLGVALGQDQVAPGIGERLGQNEADPLTGAGDDAAVAAQVEKVPGYVGDWERHVVSFLHISPPGSRAAIGKASGANPSEQTALPCWGPRLPPTQQILSPSIASLDLKPLTAADLTGYPQTPPFNDPERLLTATSQPGNLLISRTFWAYKRP